MSYIGNEPGVASQRVVSTFTATAGQTTFTPTSGYTLGYADVYLNGVKLVNGDDYTASNGVNIVLASGAALNDVVEVVAHFPRGLSDGYLKAESDARFLKLDGTNSMTGNLGIGTATPATRLNLENAGACQIQVAYNSTTYGRIGRTAGGNYEFSSYENGASLLFGTSNSNGSTTTNMTLDRYGNLGVGVTPSAWSSGYKALQLSGGSMWSYSSSYLDIVQNVYFSNPSHYYINSAAATFYRQSSGQHAWYTAPSGTAGNTVSFTQSLALGKGTTLALEGASTVSGTGISFPATQAASSDANTLDDYEEGTWTPTFTGSTGNPSLSYTVQEGRYVKIGKMVYCYVSLGKSTSSGGSGTVNISGLPFAAAAFGYGALTKVSSWNWGTAADSIIVQPSTQYAQVWDSGTNTISIATFNSSTNPRVVGMFMYETSA